MERIFRPRRGACRLIMSLFEARDMGNAPFDLENWTQRQIPFGKYDDIVAHAGCLVCKLVLKMILAPCQQQNTAYEGHWSCGVAHEYFVTLIPLWGEHSQFPSWSAYNSAYEHKHKVEVHEDKKRYLGRLYCDSTKLGLQLLPNHLEPAVLAEWISSCTLTHAGEEPAVRNPKSLTPVDITLIDVVDRCLVRSSSKTRYLALSYVWGGVAGLQLEISNRANLEIRGSLESESHELPRTIYHAIHLTFEMGERYIWIDSLCIEQDNPVQKHFNISRMDSIYSQAVATLVVLSGTNADSAIPGFSGRRLQPFEVDPSEGLAVGYPQYDKVLAVEYPQFDQVLADARYETRAWTLQERVLSSRCIFLADRGAYFYCRHGFFLCDTGWGRPSIRIQSMLDPIMLQGSQSGPQPVLQRYAALVHLYTARNLSFDTDSLNAFSGMLALLQDMSGGESVGGLLEALLDQCLLWVPVVESNRPQQLSTRNDNFCSWSWAGWTGAKSYFNGPLYLGDFELKQYGLVNRRPELEVISCLEDVGASYETAIRALRTFTATTTQKAQETKPGMGRDVLHFTAEVARASQFRILERPRNGERGTVQLQGSAMPCGLIYHLNVLLCYSKQMPSLSLLALSKSKCPRHKKSFGEAGSRFSPERHTHQSYCTKTDCFIIHVMIIQWRGERAERVGLASIQQKAWEQVERVKRRVTLV